MNMFSKNNINAKEEIISFLAIVIAGTIFTVSMSKLKSKPDKNNNKVKEQTMSEKEFRWTETDIKISDQLCNIANKLNEELRKRDWDNKELAEETDLPTFITDRALAANQDLTISQITVLEKTLDINLIEVKKLEKYEQ